MYRESLNITSYPEILSTSQESDGFSNSKTSLQSEYYAFWIIIIICAWWAGGNPALGRLSFPHPQWGVTEAKVKHCRPTLPSRFTNAGLALAEASVRVATVVLAVRNVAGVPLPVGFTLTVNRSGRVPNATLSPSRTVVGTRVHPFMRESRGRHRTGGIRCSNSPLPRLQIHLQQSIMKAELQHKHWIDPVQVHLINNEAFPRVTYNTHLKVELQNAALNISQTTQKDLNQMYVLKLWL